MAKYRMEVLAYQEVEVEADSLEEAMSKGDIGRSRYFVCRMGD